MDKALEPTTNEGLETTVCISFTRYGIHCWPSCNIKEVDFLKHPHGHTFHFKMYFKVSELDREIEFFDMKGKVLRYLDMAYRDYSRPYDMLDFGSMSCEQIADSLLRIFKASKVEVSEDGLDGAIVERKKKRG